MFAWPARTPEDSHIERGSGRILTTHTGSLPRPTDLVNSLIDRNAGKPIDPAALASRVSDAVANGRGHFVVIRLKEIVAASPDKETSDALEAELRQGFQGDLINGFEQAIRDARGVKVYHQLVDNLF